MICKGQFIIYNIVFLFIIISVSSTAMSADPLVIYTVNYPLKYFAERIGGKHVEVVFPAPADVDPAYWMPDAKTIADYQKADLILLNGAHYAKWVEKVSLPRSKMLNTSRKLKDQYIFIKEAVTHSHGPKGEHAHEDAVFTTWLDFDLAAKQVKEIEKALSRKRPDLKSIFKRNSAIIGKDLVELDQEMKDIVSNTGIINSHVLHRDVSGTASPSRP